jgi:hypothetical protein
MRGFVKGTRVLHKVNIFGSKLISKMLITIVFIMNAID